MSGIEEKRNALDPFPWYRAMARSAPVRYDSQGRVWHVFSHAEISQVLKDPTTFSNVAPITASDWLKCTTVLSDPPRHTFLRKAVQSGFDPRTVDRWKPRIVEIINQILDPLIERGRMNFLHDFAVPLPILLMASILDIPKSDFRQFKVWCDSAAANAKPSDDGVVAFDLDDFTSSRARFGTPEVVEYFTELARTRRRNLGDDLLSALISAEDGGVHLTDREVAANCFQVLLAGNETTSYLLGCVVMCLQEHPHVWDEIRTDRLLIPGMIEEVLRFKPSLHGVVRRVTTETSLGGQRIPAGDLLIAWLAAGNRDPKVHSAPDVFDIRRSPNRHLTFGQGLHFCIGAPLARLEAKLAFEIIVDRLGRLSVPSPAKLFAIPSVTLFGVKEIPVTFGREDRLKTVEQ